MPTTADDASSLDTARRLETAKSYVDRQVAEGGWREQSIPAEVVGLTRDLRVFRAVRSTNFIVHEYHGDEQTFCPPMWSDLAVGSGACGLGCRSCFLMLTFRAMRDPLRHVLYENVEDHWSATRKWLLRPERRPLHSLGVGIDRSDSLLYEGVTGHVQHLAPLFADPATNPAGCTLILLTKSRNTHYLEGLPTARTAVTFSINPEPIADLWEGKWPDSGSRITPPIRDRLLAARFAQDQGFEIRWRIDPILTPSGWEAMYREFLAEAAALGVKPRYITLGTYREKTAQLDSWRQRWDLPKMEWTPLGTVKEGTHRHLPEPERARIYAIVRDLCHGALPESRVSLCKETHSVRKQVQLCNAHCNCLR